MNIDKLLEEKGITKAILAERMGILPQNVNANLKNPKEDTIRKIAIALEIPTWQLFASEEEIASIQTSTTCPHCGKPITINIS